MKLLQLRSIIALLALLAAFVVMSPFATNTMAHYTQADCDSADATCVLAIQSAYNACKDQEDQDEYSDACNDAQTLAGSACSAATYICAQVGNNF